MPRGGPGLQTPNMPRGRDASLRENGHRSAGKLQVPWCTAAGSAGAQLPEARVRCSLRGRHVGPRFLAAGAGILGLLWSVAPLPSRTDAPEPSHLGPVYAPVRTPDCRLKTDLSVHADISSYHSFPTPGRALL